MKKISITTQPINITACINWAMSPETGGIDVFVGTVRQTTKGKNVVRLEFEAYEPMALAEMHKIADAMLAAPGVNSVLLCHRTGILAVGDVPVVIVAAATHREAAFIACRYAIDTLKITVPIWKKEVFEDGETWVAAHP